MRRMRSAHGGAARSGARSARRHCALSTQRRSALSSLEINRVIVEISSFEIY